jgi:hypothetical protein
MDSNLNYMASIQMNIRYIMFAMYIFGSLIDRVSKCQQMIGMYLLHMLYKFEHLHMISN